MCGPRKKPEIQEYFVYPRQGNRAQLKEHVELSDCHSVTLCFVSMDVILQRWIPLLGQLAGLRCLTLSCNHLDCFAHLEPSVCLQLPHLEMYGYSPADPLLSFFSFDFASHAHSVGQTLQGIQDLRVQRNSILSMTRLFRPLCLFMFPNLSTLNGDPIQSTDRIQSRTLFGMYDILATFSSCVA